MSTLESLGWNPVWAGRFAVHARPGWFPGRISVEQRALYHFCGERGEGVAQVSGRLRFEARGRADFPAVGDWVVLQQAPSDSLAVIHAVLPRTNRFSRKAAGRETEEQIIAANLDTLFLVTSLNRDLKPRRIERYLTAVSSQAVEPVVVLNKSDLCDRPEEAVEEFRQLMPGIVVHAVSAYTGDGLETLAPYLGSGRTAALVGSSGVGKSTLLNRLLGYERQLVHEVRADDDRGRHTTTYRELIRLPQGGLLIDNPGMRELQLWDEGSDLDGTFADIAVLTEQCRFSDCRHEQEPYCAVRQAIADGMLDPQRFENYRKLQREMAYLETRRDPSAERRKKEEFKRVHRVFQREMRRRKQS